MTPFLLIAAFVLAPQGPVQPSSSPAQASGPKDRAAATAAERRPDRLYLAGTLRVIDVEAKAITFDDEQGQRHTWPVNANLAANAPIRARELLATLKPGQKVWVTYDEDEQGQPRSIIELRPWTPPRPREERRPGPAASTAPVSPGSPAPPR